MNAEIETSWHSYPSSYALGHRLVTDLLSGPVVVQEKIDGSQFSFGIFKGEIRIRSKNQQMHVDAPERLFNHAVATVKLLAPRLIEGWTYRAEYLAKPKHNTLAYSRIPRQHLILYDVNTGHEVYLDQAQLADEAYRLELEKVPTFHIGLVKSLDDLQALLETESVLGGTKIEGVVIKNYNLFTLEKKIMVGKFVRADFKEKNQHNWKQENPGQGDIILRLGEIYKTEARWRKTIQHLRDAGELEGTPRDIGKLILETKLDVLRDSTDEIKTALFNWAWPNIARQIVSGLPEWYKAELAKEQPLGEETPNV